MEDTVHNEPFLTVWMITYNHERFIAQALDSVLMQKTNFRYEILIGEDCSTDKTRTILKEYEKKYPGVISAIYQDHNVGAMRNAYEFCYPLLKGKYIALCEGDDFWTDPFKLQKQVDFLESNADFSICSGNAIRRNEISATECEWLGKNHRSVSTLRDILRYGSGGATCTLLFRNNLFDKIPEWLYTLTTADWPLQILCTTNGKMKYFPEVLGVYRINEGGVTTTKSLDGQIKLFENNGIHTINVLMQNYKTYKRELKAHAAEFWYYNLIFLYSAKGHRKKTRNTIYKVIKQAPYIKITFADYKKIVTIYFQNLLFSRSFLKRIIPASIIKYLKK